MKTTHSSIMNITYLIEVHHILWIPCLLFMGKGGNLGSMYRSFLKCKNFLYTYLFSILVFELLILHEPVLFHYWHYETTTPSIICSKDILCNSAMQFPTLNQSLDINASVLHNEYPDDLQTVGFLHFRLSFRIIIIGQSQSFGCMITSSFQYVNSRLD